MIFLKRNENLIFVQKYSDDIIANITSPAAWIKNPFRKTSEHNHRYKYLKISIFSQELIHFCIKLNLFLNKNWI